MATAAAVLQGLGIVSGTSSTTFEPDGTLTRAELCTMAVNAMGLSGQVSTYSRRTLFSDVPASAWYNGYVNLAANEGIISTTRQPKSARSGRRITPAIAMPSACLTGSG